MDYVISQIAFSGNKGASGMGKALIQNLRTLDPDAKFHVLSYYPAADRRLTLPPDVEIVDGAPVTVLLRALFSGWIFFCRKLHLPAGLWRFGAMKTLGSCDLWIDAAGISFADGREKFTLFNIFCLLPALAAGRRIVKAPQALGPFEHRFNRLLAKLFLPKMKLIAARGGRTAEYLAQLRLTNTIRYSDIAFSLNCRPRDAERMAEVLPPKGKRPKLIGISPSQVVFSLCARQRIPYLAILRDFIRSCLAAGFHCVIFPHSARENCGKRHNNDLPVLRELHAMLPEDNGGITWIEREWSDCELRMLI